MSSFMTKTIQTHLHPIAILKAIVSIGLSVPLFVLANYGLGRYLGSAANLFLVLTLFMALIGLTLLVFGWRYLIVLHIKEDVIEERLLGWFVLKRLKAEGLGIRSAIRDYRLFKVKTTLIADANNRQIRFTNFDYRNYNAILETLQQRATASTFSVKIPVLDRLFIVLIILVAAWSVLSRVFGWVF